MHGWVTLRSVQPINTLPDLLYIMSLKLKNTQGTIYSVSWERSHVTSRLDEWGYVESHVILSHYQDVFPTKRSERLDPMTITSDFLSSSQFVDLEVYAFTLARENDALVTSLVTPCVGIENGVGGKFLSRLPSDDEFMEVFDLYDNGTLIQLDMYPTLVEISDEGRFYTYLEMPRVTMPVTPRV